MGSAPGFWNLPAPEAWRLPAWHHSTSPNGRLDIAEFTELGLNGHAQVPQRMTVAGRQSLQRHCSVTSPPHCQPPPPAWLPRGVLKQIAPERQPGADCQLSCTALHQPPRGNPGKPASGIPSKCSPEPLGSRHFFVKAFWDHRGFSCSVSCQPGILEPGGPMPRVCHPCPCKAVGSHHHLAFSLCVSLLHKTIHGSTYLFNLAEYGMASQAS